MSWRDFFYFSKGERNALILLLCLITSSGIILILTNPPSFKPIETPPATSQQTRPEASVTSSDPSSFAISSTPTTDSSGRTAMRNESNPPSTSSRQPTTRRESTSERFNRMTSNQTSYPRTEKYSTGTVVELNSADTTILKKVPGIGSAFANRIVRFRNLLGGFYTVQQLAEVYGIDEERYTDLAPWF
ncbi:MAG: helix-hairpin-helix domain-containing protein, partial [Tannerella sp.]|nr:helix-hairpin-helix domain-containing protein [Tannerella sp.]